MFLLKNYTSCRVKVATKGRGVKEFEETSMDSSLPQKTNSNCNYMQPGCNGWTETSEKQEPINCQWGPWRTTRCNRSCGKGQKLDVVVKRGFSLKRLFFSL